MPRTLRRWSWLAILAVLPACLGPQGPQLPEDVGSSHRPRGGSSGAESEEPAEPVEVGTPVWANFHDTGFYFFGVVVERRGDDSHRVIYADGASEWVSASALLPDHLAEDAEIHVRPDFNGAFATGHLGRRLGGALYVRFASGDEGWAPLPHVRFQANADGVPVRGDAPDDTGSRNTAEPGSTVLVNYQRQNLRFAGVVTARGDDGRLHVVYLDGETEWVDPGLVVPDELDEGDVVHVRRVWDPPEWVRGRIRRRLGHAVHIELDDGGLAWSSIFRLRVPVAGAQPAPESTDPAADPATDPEAATP